MRSDEIYQDLLGSLHPVQDVALRMALQALEPDQRVDHVQSLIVEVARTTRERARELKENSAIDREAARLFKLLELAVNDTVLLQLTAESGGRRRYLPSAEVRGLEPEKLRERARARYAKLAMLTYQQLPDSVLGLRDHFVAHDEVSREPSEQWGFVETRHALWDVILGRWKSVKPDNEAEADELIVFFVRAMDRESRREHWEVAEQRLREHIRYASRHRLVRALELVAAQPKHPHFRDRFDAIAKVLLNALVAQLSDAAGFRVVAARLGQLTQVGLDEPSEPVWDKVLQLARGTLPLDVVANHVLRDLSQNQRSFDEQAAWRLAEIQPGEAPTFTLTRELPATMDADAQSTLAAAARYVENQLRYRFTGYRAELVLTVQGDGSRQYRQAVGPFSSAQAAA